MKFIEQQVLTAQFENITVAGRKV